MTMCWTDCSFYFLSQLSNWKKIISLKMAYIDLNWLNHTTCMFLSAYVAFLLVKKISVNILIDITIFNFFSSSSRSFDKKIMKKKKCKNGSINLSARLFIQCKTRIFEWFDLSQMKLWMNFQRHFHICQI